MTAYLFRIDLPDGRACGVICPETSFLSILRENEQEPRRRELTPAEWRSVELELARPLPSAALPKDSGVVTALLESGLQNAAEVRYLVVMPVNVPPDRLTEHLDGLLVGL